MTYQYTTTAADTGFWAAFAGLMLVILNGLFSIWYLWF